MTAVEHKLVMEQGATFSEALVWTIDGVPVDLTGYTAHMQVRANAGDADPPLADFTTSDGSIILGTTDGSIKLYKTDEQTILYTWKQGVYDLNLISPDGVRTRLIKGSIINIPSVTAVP